MRLQCLTLALLLSCVAIAHADDRLPIPDAAAQKEADELVQEVYGDEIAKAKTPDEKSALIKKLLEESAKPDTTSAGRYAILKAALVTAPDANVAMSVIENMAEHFQIEGMQAKAYTLKKMSAITPSERKALAESAVELAGSYTEQDNYEAALALIDIALDAATKSRDSQLIRDIRAKKDDVSSLEEKYADVKAALATLETDPTEAKSNLIAGRYKCFVKGEWEDGLPMLALGDEEALKALAIKELKGPKASNEQVALADGWYDLAQQAGELNKERMLHRAGFWYQAALKSEPELSRLVKAKVEKRLFEVKRSSGDVYLIAEFQNYANNKKLGVRMFYSNGYLSPAGGPSWKIKGKTLTLRFPPIDGRSSVWDKLELSPDGRSYKGINSYGTPVHGTLIKGINLLEWRPAR